MRRATMVAVSAAALLAGGCAVGKFVTGAPSAHEARPDQALLVRRCSGCHEVPEPKAMRAAEWQAALERMKLRMRLPETDWDSLAAMSAHR